MAQVETSLCNHQPCRTKSKIFQNGYQNSDDDGDDESDNDNTKRQAMNNEIQGIQDPSYVPGHTL